MRSQTLENTEVDTKIARSTYTWNMIAGIINAAQSVIILMVLTRACDVVSAGVFTLAYANANLFLNVGKYGMRSFQASDRDGQYSFICYRTSRVATTLAMIVLAGAYISYLSTSNAYSADKTLTMGVVCLYLAVTSFEDVFHGNFQQFGRLDVASRLFSLRVGSSTVVLCLAVVATHSLAVAVVVATVYTILFLVGELAFAQRRYELPVLEAEHNRESVPQLLRACLPLFLAAFFLFYIGNAPRYAIDAMLGDSAQAYYGYIAMPVFVVSLLAGFIYNPMITSLTDQWNSGQVRVFAIRFAKVAVAIVGITIACDLAALVAGVPVLEVLYNADMAPYLGDLLVLVTGGGFLALVWLAVTGITIIRAQRIIVPAYTVIAILAWVLSELAVGRWGISGAAWTYLACMVALSLLLGVMFVLKIISVKAR